jgi:hypothetical protein
VKNDRENPVPPVVAIGRRTPTREPDWQQTLVPAVVSDAKQPRSADFGREMCNPRLQAERSRRAARWNQATSFRRRLRALDRKIDGVRDVARRLLSVSCVLDKHVQQQTRRQS